MNHDLDEENLSPESKLSSSPESKLSLSPESGSLFHCYHHKLKKSKEDPLETGPSVSKFSKRESYTIHRPHNPVKSFDSPVRRPASKTYSGLRFNFKPEKYPLLEVTDFLTAQNEAEAHCSKIFHLKEDFNEGDSLWVLPALDQLYIHEKWMIEELISMKNNLNKTKGLLENFDIEAWHKHTQLSNPAQRISNCFRYKAKPELLTQAFLKFYEILHAFPIVPEFDDPAKASLKTLHLCEAPGAFIIALNHYLALHRPNIKWQWLGNTLNPYFEGTPSKECIADDRFIIHTLDNWCFGKEETGNLMSSDYLDELISRVGRNKIDLVTADGSIDCQGNPAEQENMTNSLHFCEVYSALATLRGGGCLVLKKFTFFEVDSICLVYLICCCFDNVSIYKPITSKLGNSEVYLVALGFKPSRIAPYMNKLRMYYGQKVDSKVMFGSEHIPSNFITKIKECSTFFKGHQAKAIERNIYLYNNPSEKNSQYVELLKSMILEIFEDNNFCLPIASNQRIVLKKMDWDHNVIPDRHNTKWGGQIKKRVRDERLKFLKTQYMTILELFQLASSAKISETNKYTYNSKILQNKSSYLNCINLKMGKPFHFVFFSRFCLVNILQVHLHYLEECFLVRELNKAVESHSELIPWMDHLYKAHVSKFNNSVTTENKPSQLVLDEGFYIAPHNCHKAFDQLIDLMARRELKEGSDIVFLNCVLYTRLQMALFLILSSVFGEIQFHQPSSIPLGPPYFIFKNYTSVANGENVVDILRKHNWFNATIVNELLPLDNLINNTLYPDLCKYNSMFSLSQIGLLKSILD